MSSTLEKAIPNATPVINPPHPVFKKHDVVFKIAAFTRNPEPFSESSKGVHLNAIPQIEGGKPCPGFLAARLYRDLLSLGYEGLIPMSFTNLGLRPNRTQREKIYLDILKSLKDLQKKNYPLCRLKHCGKIEVVLRVFSNLGVYEGSFKKLFRELITKSLNLALSPEEDLPFH